MRDRQPMAPGARSAAARVAARAPAHPAHAAALQLQRTVGNRTLARWVGQRASGGTWKYYSSFEPKVLYDTLQEAEAADRKHERQAGSMQLAWNAITRYATLYTYTHTNPNNAITRAPQGPHTVSHVNVSDALAGQTMEGLQRTFARHVPTPSDFNTLLRDERGDAGHTLTHEYARVEGDYGRIYAATQRVLATGSLPVEYGRSLLASLMNLHPYATYGWKSNRDVSQSSSAGKGERATTFNVDRSGRQYLRHPERFDEFVEARRELWEARTAGGSSASYGTAIAVLLAVVAGLVLLFLKLAGS